VPSSCSVEQRNNCSRGKKGKKNQQQRDGKKLIASFLSSFKIFPLKHFDVIFIALQSEIVAFIGSSNVTFYLKSLLNGMFIYIYRMGFILLRINNWHRMEVSRGANLVGMSVWPPDVCLSPCLAKKLRINKLLYIKFVTFLKYLFV